MNDRNVMSRNTRKRKSKKRWIGRTVLLLLVIGICYGAYSVAKSLIGTGTASATGSELVVTEVAAFASAAVEKEVPKEYNGMTRKVAYLTFDDGPSKYSNDMLDLLDKNGIKATFFMLGDNMRTYPDAVKRIVEDGHYPGLHSMSHDYNKLYKSGGSGISSRNSRKPKASSTI